jgi:hypothetical protein
MGLTVQYKLAAPAGYTGAQAEKLVESMRRVALRFYCEGLVDAVSPITTDSKTLRHSACDWLILPVPGQAGSSHVVEVCPSAGFLFQLTVGADCEPLRLGLCQYPSEVLSQGQPLRTKKGAAWRLSGFSKTQYASLHGWKHFFRCHSAVVEILASLPPLGCRTRINDEGGYWPRRSVAVLRAELNQMNGLVAAAAGALRDLDRETGERGASKIESPIFEHPQFERIEANGVAELRQKAKRRN